MGRLAIAVALAAAGVLIFEGAAAAHANYVKSNPASDARLTRAPTEVRVTLSETPDARGSELVVFDAGGKRYDQGETSLVAEEPNTLRVSLSTLGDSGYLVTWTALSAVDGHTTKGSFAFAVGDAPLPKLPDIGPAYEPPAPVELAGRVLSFAGVALLLGSAFFALFIYVPIESHALRRERWLVAIGGILLVGGSALLLLEQGAGVPPRLAAILGVRAATGLVAVGAQSVLEQPSALLRRAIVATCGLVAGLTATLVSHAAASGALTQVALDYVHVIAVSIWVGGVVSLLVLIVRPTRALTSRELGRVVWRFSLTALIAVATLVTTGVLQSLGRLVLVEDLVETPYGLALLAKIVLLGGLMFFGALNLLVLGPRLRGGQDARTPLARSVLGESALFAAALVATSFLTALSPPAQSSGAAFDETKRVDGLRIALLVPTTLPGQNRYVVRAQQGLTPVTGAEKVALRFTMVEHDMGEQELIASERAPGEYVAQGSPTAMFGTWKVEAILRLSGREDVRALFTVPIAQQAGQAATAKVILAPPYTMIVFPEPTQPVAGAPLSINVVVVDEKGDPVRGGQVRATFSGPAAQSPIDAVEDAAGGAPGRYRISLAGLEAGAWEVTIGIGGRSGVFKLDVLR